jgi:hypothetical protein
VRRSGVFGCGFPHLLRPLDLRPARVACRAWARGGTLRNARRTAEDGRGRSARSDVARHTGLPAGGADRPSEPVRWSQRPDRRLFSVVAQPGQHAVIYGERGVGKTSLAGVAAEMLASANVLTARATCDVSDDFSSVWQKSLGEIVIHSSALAGASSAASPAAPARVRACRRGRARILRGIRRA